MISIVCLAASVASIPLREGDEPPSYDEAVRFDPSVDPPPYYADTIRNYVHSVHREPPPTYEEANGRFSDTIRLPYDSTRDVLCERSSSRADYERGNVNDFPTCERTSSKIRKTAEIITAVVIASFPYCCMAIAAIVTSG